MTPHWTEWQRAAREAQAYADDARAAQHDRRRRTGARALGAACAATLAGALGYVGAAAEYLSR